ncbi:MAG: hypothetical protein H0V12_08235, partial [Chloroflexi bacterium]|nr:hypothetical protein [Chloroflexota bacterium]
MVPRPVRPLDERVFFFSRRIQRRRREEGGSEMTQASPATTPNAATTPAVDERVSLSKVYEPASVEPTIYQRWLDADVFAPDGAGSRAA